MNNLTQPLLEQRLYKIEKELFWWKRGVLFCLLIMASFPLMGQLFSTQPKILDAQRIIIRGWDGEVRMVIGDQPINAGVTPDFLYTKPLEPDRAFGDWGIHLYKSDGMYSSGLVNRTLGGGTLILKDQTSASGVWLATGNDYADLHMFATDQTAKEKQEEDEDFWPKWNAGTPDDRVRLEALRRPRNYEARLVLAKTHARFGLTEKGQQRAVLGQVALENKNGVVEEHPISSLVLFDKNGKAVWSALR